LWQSSRIFFDVFDFCGFAMPENHAAEARTLPSHRRTILFETVYVLVCGLLTLIFSVVSVVPSFAAGDRNALVIGNARYRDADAPTKAPINDARDIADEFKRRGFNVDIGENLTGEQMRRAFERLYGKIKPGSIALIFFSGFGVQSNRQSYMIPVDAQIWTEPDIRRDGFSLETVLGKINSRGAGVKIALIDASRSNPFERRFRSYSGGLAPVITPSGTLVMYSAAPSSVSSDSDSDHSLFVNELLKQIRTPGLTAEEALNRTRIGVARASGNGQVPWISSSLSEEFSFIPGGADLRPASPPPPAVVAEAPAAPPAAAAPRPPATPVEAPFAAPVSKMAKASVAAGGFHSDSKQARRAAPTKRKGAARARTHFDSSPPPARIDGGRHSARPPATSKDGRADEPRTAAEISPISAPIPEPPPNTSAYWNSWFVDGVGPASNILIANNTYTFTLDIAAFDYASLRRQKTQSSAVKIDDALKTLLLDPAVPEIILNIKPIVPEGSGLRLIDAKASYSMTINLDKIRRPKGDAAARYADGSITIAEFSKQVSAGSIQMAVTAESKGCATIAFAIFKGLLPLDHLVQRVSIGDTGTSAPICDSDDPGQQNALSGGLDSLREVTLGMEGSGVPVTAAAAFHIFDFDAYSMAVFVDGRSGKSQTIYGWQTASSVVEFVKTDSFQNAILKARKDSADKKPGSYVRAAQELSKILFATKPGHTTEFEAKNAQSAFKSIVQESQGSPVVVVRVASSLIGGQNRSIYVPLGILGAKGPGAVLDKPVIVVQPMALERYPSRDKCIGDWMFAVPNELENVDEAIMPPGFFPAKIPGTRISEIEQLRQYLAAATGAAAPFLPASAAAVGFVVLAHQDEGFMWFGESTNHIMPQDIERKFPSGSVGIFAACSAASPKGRNSALLQRLNEQGIDTLIASPFSIDASYGVIFAASFAEVVSESASNKKPPTILELFDKTISKTAQKFGEKTEAEYGELGLEYVLLGNPAITLCPPPQ
jgi:hypothetical protein